jgi:hypothetical protein
VVDALDYLLARCRGVTGGALVVGGHRNTRYTARLNQEKVSAVVRERGGGDRGEEEARGSLAASESAVEACRCAKLRR